MTDEYSKKLGKIIKAKRKERKLTAKQVCKQIGYKSLPGYFLMESGYRTITLGLFVRLHRVLKFTQEEIYESFK